MKKLLLPLFLLMVGPVLPAYADCISPAGKAGAMDYFAGTENTFKFCNGAEWVNMSGGAGAVPAGAVMAFDLASCPSGWSEYAAARGRFLRGIDLSGSTALDPAGTRTPGSLQEGSLVMNDGGGAGDLRIFNLNSPQLSGLNYDKGTGVSPGFSGQYIQTTAGIVVGTWPGSGTYDSIYVGVTRPRNVAVLFCRKA